MNFELPELKKEHLPYAYILMAVGALALVKRPSTVISLVSGYFLWKDLLKKGQEALENR